GGIAGRAPDSGRIFATLGVEPLVRVVTVAQAIAQLHQILAPRSGSGA
ncbi:MAG: hypothetical protein HC838_17445, partial [Spirulinaceae cyanobacterium RM2_2_10]|nr:hypothetical protein [Spirulinaceae cyanobacterium RM2_2_10]